MRASASLAITIFCAISTSRVENAFVFAPASVEGAVRTSTFCRLRNEARKAEVANPSKKGEKKEAPRHTEADLVRKYTFIVNRDANKIEIKQALEAIYKAQGTEISVASVRTVKVLGKKRRRGQSTGYEPDRKKAIVTLVKGQMLEDYGV